MKWTAHPIAATRHPGSRPGPSPVWLALVLVGLLGAASAAAADQDRLAAFAIGRGGAAAKTAVDVQHQLRQLTGTTGNLSLIDLRGLLDAGDEPERKQAVAEAKALLDAGRRAYEQLELQSAQAKFDRALKKFEYGYGYVERTGPLVETLLYLGASWVLVGEADRGLAYFRRAADLPGRKTLDEELFPPNIQQVFEQAAAAAGEGPRARASLLTVPQGAAVFVDGSYRGGSPLRLGDMRPGVHLVRALKDGFRPWGGKIRLKANRQRRLKLTLEPTARRKQFSRHFRKLSAELIGDQPGADTRQMMDFLAAGRLVMVVIEGEPAALTMRGLVCTLNPDLQHAQRKVVLDSSSPGYAERLKEFLIALLQTEPRDAFAEEPVAAAESPDDAGAEGDLGTQLGLDLGDGTPAEEEGPAAGDRPDADQTTAQADTGAAERERDREEQAAAAAVADAGTDEPDAGEPAFAFTWTYLHDKWWFWTAVGVVAAGAATGTYFGATAGGGGDRGELVLGLH